MIMSSMAASLIRSCSASALAKSTVASYMRGTSNRRFVSISCASYHLHLNASIASVKVPTCPTNNISGSRQYISSSTSCKDLSKSGDGQPPSAELHSMFHDQMKEIQSEREAIFGAEPPNASDSPNLTDTAKPYLDPKEDHNIAIDDDSSPTPNSNPPPTWNADEAYAEREAIYEFTEEEKSAWSNNTDAGMAQMSSAQIQHIQDLMRSSPDANVPQQLQQSTSPSSSEPSPFTHLTNTGDGVSMVDVGHKSTSRRVAVARSVVVFPPEVMSAFQVNNSHSEMIGPKGPIFETAKIAGIMGAKKTSDLIPLCHPLPLDRVNITIQLINNQAVIECECRVTHKTGVEMEALTGATIAALTIYDMVKAVSHRVEIGQTVLVRKSGGKSDYVHN